MSADEADFLLDDQDLAAAGWKRDGDTIERDITLSDFQAALDAVTAIGALAEDEDHHPDLLIHGYKHLRITLSTHAIGGLSENDFIVAAKAEKILDAIA